MYDMHYCITLDLLSAWIVAEGEPTKECVLSNDPQ
jgi:hypothetical protein